MHIVVMTPLEEECSALVRSLLSQGYTMQARSVGRLVGHFFPELDMLLVQSGHGKTQSALQTQHVLDHLEHREKIDIVLCAGAAGALISDLAVGDLVVGEVTLEHDYLLRFVQRPAPQFIGSQEFLAILRSRPVLLEHARVHYGIIASGDEDIVERERGQALHRQTGALAVAWEGAGVARACRFTDLPYLEIRGITDNADHNAPVVFRENLEIAMAHIGRLLVLLLGESSSLPASINQTSQ